MTRRLSGRTEGPSKRARVYLQKPPSTITPSRVIKNNLTVLLKIRNTPTAIEVSRSRLGGSLVYNTKRIERPIGTVYASNGFVDELQ